MPLHYPRWIAFSHCEERKSFTPGFFSEDGMFARLAAGKKFVKAASPLATHRTDDGGQLLLTPALIGNLQPFRPGLERQ